jgi:hypothetical protein
LAVLASITQSWRPSKPRKIITSTIGASKFNLFIRIPLLIHAHSNKESINARRRELHKAGKKRKERDAAAKSRAQEEEKEKDEVYAMLVDPINDNDGTIEDDFQ